MITINLIITLIHGIANSVVIYMLLKKWDTSFKIKDVDFMNMNN